MRLEEIKAASAAAEQRVSRMEANAKTVKARETQVKALADANAMREVMQKSRDELTRLQGRAVNTSIKPYR
jgi:predicted flap endonuclease-1-like 5' DNA nuclease